jgi:hypothetical protein
VIEVNDLLEQPMGMLIVRHEVKDCGKWRPVLTDILERRGQLA